MFRICYVRCLFTFKSAVMTEHETKNDFWNRTKNYHKRYCRQTVCIKKEDHDIYCCIYCVYWDYCSLWYSDVVEFDDELKYDLVNFVCNTKKGLITICARRQPKENNSKIDMFVDDPEGKYEHEPCVELENYTAMEHLMSRPLEGMLKKYNQLHKRAIQPKLLTLAEVKNIFL